MAISMEQYCDVRNSVRDICMIAHVLSTMCVPRIKLEYPPIVDGFYDPLGQELRMIDAWFTTSVLVPPGLSKCFFFGGRTKTYAILWGMNMRKSQLSFGVHQGVPHGWNLSQHVPLRSGERWRFDEVFGPRASNWDLYERSVGGPGCGVRGGCDS